MESAKSAYDAGDAVTRPVQSIAPPPAPPPTHGHSTEQADHRRPPSAAAPMPRCTSATNVASGAEAGAGAGSVPPAAANTFFDMTNAFIDVDKHTGPAPSGALPPCELPGSGAVAGAGAEACPTPPPSATGAPSSLTLVATATLTRRPAPEQTPWSPAAPAPPSPAESAVAVPGAGAIAGCKLATNSCVWCEAGPCKVRQLDEEGNFACEPCFDLWRAQGMDDYKLYSRAALARERVLAPGSGAVRGSGEHQRIFHQLVLAAASPPAGASPPAAVSPPATSAAAAATAASAAAADASAGAAAVSPFEVSRRTADTPVLHVTGAGVARAHLLKHERSAAGKAHQQELKRARKQRKRAREAEAGPPARPVVEASSDEPPTSALVAALRQQVAQRDGLLASTRKRMRREVRGASERGEQRAVAKQKAAHRAKTTAKALRNTGGAARRDRTQRKVQRDAQQQQRPPPAPPKLRRHSHQQGQPQFRPSPRHPPNQWHRADAPRAPNQR